MVQEKLQLCVSSPWKKKKQRAKLEIHFYEIIYRYFLISFIFKIFIKGHDIRESEDIAYRMIGYCPQHDALWSSLTIREHLNVYATIRGISKDQIEK